MSEGITEMTIPWHPGFYGAAEIEFAANKGDLEFHREYNLSKEPLRMDLLVIKKISDAKIKNEIGWIFKKHNVVEYKSPEDGLTIDDFYKTVGYACLYKGLGETVDQIEAKEVTVSIFRESYPREMFKALEKEGQEIEEHFPGIYYIRGRIPFDAQIVVTGRLEEKMHRSLKMLSRNIRREDIEAFIEETGRLTEPGDRDNVEAVLYVSTLANWALYEEVRRDPIMFETLKILMKDELEKEKEEAVKEAVQEAIQETEKKTIERLLRKGKMSIEEIAECCTGFSEEEIRKIQAGLIQRV